MPVVWTSPFSGSDAPRERVWQALTDPERLKEWLAPATFTTIAMNMDFRPGGFFHFGMQSGEGYKMWAKYVYQEIVPPERIVFINSFSNQAGEITRHPIVPTWPRETRVMVKSRAGGKTRLNVRWTPHNATEVEQKAFDVSHVGMQATWGRHVRSACRLSSTDGLARTDVSDDGR